MVRMVIAALTGTGPVLATAGPLGALLIVLANLRVFANPFVAPPVLGAVAIDATFGADTRPVIEVVAAEETVAAVELLAAIVSGEDPANRAFRLAAEVIVDAVAVAAFLTLAAFAVAGAFFAVGTRRAVVVRAAGIQWNALVIAALLILGAVAGTDPQCAIATAAVVVVAAFGAIAAFATGAAEQVIAAVTLGAGSPGDGAALARFAATGADLHAFVVAAFLALAAGADALALDTDFAVARAIGIEAAFLAGAVAVESAAMQTNTAFEQLTRAGIAFGDAKMRALAHWHAYLAAAFLILRARGIGKARAVDTCAITWAFVVGAALARRPAIIGEGAAILLTGAPSDTFAIETFAADRNAIGISAALRLLANAARVAHFAPGASIVVAATRAIGVRRTIAAAALASEAIGKINAFADDARGGFAGTLDRRAIGGITASERANAVATDARAAGDATAVDTGRARVARRVARHICAGAGAVESGGQRRAANDTAKQSLERRSARGPPRQRARQGIESLIVHGVSALSQYRIAHRRARRPSRVRSHAFSENLDR
jgi:hypothetical protein